MGERERERERERENESVLRRESGRRGRRTHHDTGVQVLGGGPGAQVDMLPRSKACQTAKARGLARDLARPRPRRRVDHPSSAADDADARPFVRRSARALALML